MRQHSVIHDCLIYCTKARFSSSCFIYLTAGNITRCDGQDITASPTPSAAMDLQKSKKARPGTHNDQDDSAEYRVNGYGRAPNPTNCSDNDESDPRQDTPNTAATKLTAASQVSDSLGRELVARDSIPAILRAGDCCLLITAMRIPAGINLDAHQRSHLRCAELRPPVTKETLSELDLERIMRNIHLRTDANFEPDLHFKPDLDGEKGRKKRKLADNYWEALLVEITIYASIAGGIARTDDVEIVQLPISETLQDDFFQPRLPLMFETLQEILKTLVPERDHPSVSQNLDVPLLMQQVRKGVLDLVGISTWLAALLKMHCAPMRDQVADEMVAHISEGSACQDMRRVVTGLRTLFDMMEMMKLDVANHQIRAFRIVLIEDTVPFLQDYFCKCIASHEFRIEESKAWYKEVRKGTTDCPVQSFFPISVLLRGLCGLLLQSDDCVKFPQTFHFDTPRLWQLRNEVQNLVNIHVCWSIFESLLNHTSIGDPYSRRSLHSTFIMRISVLLGNDKTPAERDFSLGTRLPNDASIALEIARLLCEASGQVNEVSDHVLRTVEGALKKSFTEESSRYQLVRECVRQQLLQTTYEIAQRYLAMSPLEICESQRTCQLLRPQTSDIEYIATKLAHIGVLHWRVWAPLAYSL